MAQLVILKIDKVNQSKGDIIEVRRTDSPVGGEEPNHFIFVNIPDMDIEQFRHLSRCWDDINGTTLAVRRYSVPANRVDAVITAGGVVTLNLSIINTEIHDKSIG